MCTVSIVQGNVPETCLQHRPYSNKTVPDTSIFAKRVDPMFCTWALIIKE